MVEYRLVLLPEQDVGLFGFYNSPGGDMASWVITGQTGGFRSKSERVIHQMCHQPQGQMPISGA
ncbi:MAG: hypothetical protein ACETWR_10830 [Anaerolineae bacterium]